MREKRETLRNASISCQVKRDEATEAKSREEENQRSVVQCMLGIDSGWSVVMACVQCCRQVQ